MDEAKSAGGKERVAAPLGFQGLLEEEDPRPSLTGRNGRTEACVASPDDDQVDSCHLGHRVCPSGAAWVNATSAEDRLDARG